MPWYSYFDPGKNLKSLLNFHLLGLKTSFRGIRRTELPLQFHRLNTQRPNADDRTEKESTSAECSVLLKR